MTNQTFSLTKRSRLLFIFGLLTLFFLASSLAVSAQTTSCTTNCLRVFNIKMFNLGDKLSGNVTVVDEVGGRIFGAVVHGVWTLPDGSTIDQYDLIGVRGRAEFKIYSPTQSGIYTLAVADITKDGYTFDPANSAMLSNTVSYTAPSQNQAPTAVASVDVASGPAPLAVNFSSVGSSDPDGTIAAYAWDFGDGGSSTAANPSYTYSTAGSYTATLTVTDNEGATGIASISINAAGDTTTCSVNCLRVAYIRMYDILGKTSGLVTMVDENGGNVFGTVVHAVWTMPDGSQLDQYANIGVRGRAEFKLYPTVSGVYTLTVVGATKDGYTFDPVNSSLTSASINISR